MNKISNIKIISIDLFRTLIDLEDGDELIYETFLKGTYSDTLAKKYRKRAKEILTQKWNDAGIDEKHFKNERMIFEEILVDLFNEIGLYLDPQSAANIIIDQHKHYNAFEDTFLFLKTVSEQYRICLSTDCDIDMITGIDEFYSFDYVFVSEELQAYKLNPKFFNLVIEHYNVKPENIMHIGDSKSDIVAPKTLGVLTCWLNRKGLKWDHNIRPDFEVNSLRGVIHLLELN